MRLAGRSTSVALIALLSVGVLASPAVAKTDKQIAKAATLKASDLGPGWDAAKHTDDGPTGLPSCEATDAADKSARKYEVNSPDFSQGDAQVTNSVFVFPKVKDAKRYLAAFQDAEARDCLQATLDEALAGTPGASATVEDLDVTGGPADDGVGFAATVTVVDAGTEQTLHLQAVAFRVGRGVTGITTQNPDQPLPDTADLATSSINRLKKGLR